MPIRNVMMMSPESRTADALCQLMKTGDEADRCYAARALGVFGRESAVDTLLSYLRDEDVDVCMDAAEALGRIGAQRAVPGLIQSLQDPSGEVCTAVARALGRIGGGEALSALIGVATVRPPEIEWENDWDTWWDVQLEAVRGLGALGDEQAVSPLISILEDESQQDIESEILSALGHIGGSGTAYLVGRLQNHDCPPLHRRKAARALGALHGDARAVSALGRALQDAAPEVRAESLLGLVRQHALHYLRAITLLLRDPEPEVRCAAIEGITTLYRARPHEINLQDTLSPLIEDPSGKVRARLYDAISNSEPAAPVKLQDALHQALVSSLHDPSIETAAAACRLLGRGDDLNSRRELLGMLNSSAERPMVRCAAAMAIGARRYYDRDVLEALTLAATDSEQSIRMSAFSALMALETSGCSAEKDRETGTPLQIIQAAAAGKLAVRPLRPESPLTSEQVIAPRVPAQQAGRLTETTAAPESEAAEPAVAGACPTLPAAPARGAADGDVKPAASTLEAIAMDNVAAAFAPEERDAQPKEADDTTREYMAVVETNKETIRRIRSNRRIDGELDVRRLGIRILGETSDQGALRVLIETLGDENELLRLEAAEAIGRIALRSPDNPALADTLGTLITQLQLGGRDQRLACVRSLGNLGNQAAVPPLLETLKDPHAGVRVCAIQALSRIVSRNTDPDAAGHMVVRKITPASIARRVLGLLDDPDMGVRVVAARELAAILGRQNDPANAETIVERIIASVSNWTGEEARQIGRALRGFDHQLVTDKLLQRLAEAGDSVKRSVVIEMLEELLNPDTLRSAPDQAA